MGESSEPNKRISFGRNAKLYLRLVKPYPHYTIIVLFFVIAISVAQLAEKYIFKLLIDYGTDFYNGLISSPEFVQILIALGIAFTITFLFKSVSSWLEEHFILHFDLKIIFDLKKIFFTHIVGLSHRFHSSHRTGSLIARLTRGGRAVESINDTIFFNITPLLVQVVIVGAAIFIFDPPSAVALLITIIVFTIYSLFILKKREKPNLDANNAEDYEKAFISDALMNIESIKYFGKENFIRKLFLKTASTTRECWRKAWGYFRWMRGGQALILGFGTIAVLYFPLIQFLNHTITIGTLAFIYTVFLNIIDPLKDFVRGIRNFYESMADLESLAGYEEITNDIVDKKNAKKLVIKKGSIEFKNIHFTYHKKKIIDGINLSIKPNEKIALVGHSGSGKTTLVKLLYRLYDVNKGAVLVDGINVKELKQESLRSELSIVPQECILFNDTIYSNILFSNPKAKRAKVFKALRFAQLYNFVMSLPDKENTLVGERGVKLSGGEKQRLSIARAILADKKILVLDEATSSLDSKTEYEIQLELAKLMKGRTTIIIAHRLSTIMSADKIIVLSKGRIVQQGTHEQLINKKGIYKQLWKLQKGGYIGK